MQALFSLCYVTAFSCHMHGSVQISYPRLNKVQAFRNNMWLGIWCELLYKLPLMGFLITATASFSFPAVPPHSSQCVYLDNAESPQPHIAPESSCQRRFTSTLRTPCLKPRRLRLLVLALPTVLSYQFAAICQTYTETYLPFTSLFRKKLRVKSSLSSKPTAMEVHRAQRGKGKQTQSTAGPGMRKDFFHLSATLTAKTQLSYAHD